MKCNFKRVRIRSIKIAIIIIFLTLAWEDALTSKLSALWGARSLVQDAFDIAVEGAVIPEDGIYVDMVEPRRILVGHGPRDHKHHQKPDFHCVRRSGSCAFAFIPFFYQCLPMPKDAT